VHVVGAVLILALGQDPKVVDLAAKSAMVLRGTVTLLDSSTVSVRDTSNLAVVRLNEIVSGPPMLKAFVGKDITVKLLSPKDVKVGEQRVFFADPWIFGDSIGVIEVGSQLVQATAAAPQTLAQDVQRGRAEAQDRRLATKLEEAQLVVAGRVTAVRPAAKPRLTEHDPQWTEADIQITDVLKGTATGTVTIVFPASNDVMWFKAPKPKQGQEGVFILRTRIEGAATPRPAVAEAEDILPLAEVPRIKKLLGR